MGTPKNRPFFQKSKNGHPQKKKEHNMGIQQKNQKIDPQKNSNLFYKRKMWFQIFLPKGCPKKKNGQKMGTGPFSKNGRSQKKNGQVPIFFQKKKRCPSSSLAYWLSNQLKLSSSEFRRKKKLGCYIIRYEKKGSFVVPSVVICMSLYVPLSTKLVFTNPKKSTNNLG